MTKEDYMRLPKERLAELLAERDLKDSNPNTTPSLECYYNPNGKCTNPYHDCVNCPRQWDSGGTTTTTNTNINK